MKFLQWMKGFFEEGTSQSSKRLAGLACIALGLIMSTLDGFGFYGVNHEIVYTVMGTGTVLLGVNAFKRN